MAADGGYDRVMTGMRDYTGLAERLRGVGEATREERMRRFVDAAWETLAQHGVSWIGFYLHDPKANAETALALGPRRDKPACSPIGLHGVCGQAFTSGATQIVRDVADLGENYVACDPRDRSEIVIPLFEDADGGEARCWGVLDVDSFDVSAFDASDERGLKDALRAAGFVCDRSGAR